MPHWIAAAALCCAALPALAQTPQQWREDLHYLAQQMPARHKNLFHTQPRAAFDAQVTALDGKLETLPRHRIIVELARIVAATGDGHTNIAPTRDPKIGFRAYPLALYLFDDGLYIRAAAQQHADLVGAKVLRIGRHSADQAYALVRDVIGKDNEQGAKFFAPHFLVMPEVLEGLGIAPDLTELSLELEQNGKRRTVTLRDARPADMMPPDTDVSFMPKAGWVDARGAHQPLWLADAHAKHRYAYLPEHKLLYIQLNQIGDEKKETMKAFAERMGQFIASHAVEKVALDLRLNRGGNGYLNQPVVVMLIKALQIDRPGHLFLLIGRSTYSAAQFLTNDLEKYTHTIFIGEPSGGKPNSYGDSRKITLPNSGLTVRVSTLWWQGDERDLRAATMPHIAADLRFDDYRNGRDPALDAVLRYRPQLTLTQRLQPHTADPQALAQAFAQWRADPANRYADADLALQQLGYALLAEKRAMQAVNVMTVWTQAAPNAANAWDSLGEAYLHVGDKARAKAAYARALVLSPGSASAVEGMRKASP
ncbi:MAG TPA: hypothetical protein VIT92_12025 [Burkholderiaceae bacterium]